MYTPIEKGRLLRSTILAGLAVASLSGAPVFAQDAEQIPEQAEDDAEPETGDRIDDDEQQVQALPSPLPSSPDGAD